MCPILNAEVFLGREIVDGQRQRRVDASSNGSAEAFVDASSACGPDACARNGGFARDGSVARDRRADASVGYAEASVDAAAAAAAWSPGKSLRNPEDAHSANAPEVAEADDASEVRPRNPHTRKRRFGARARFGGTARRRAVLHPRSMLPPDAIWLDKRAHG